MTIQVEFNYIITQVGVKVERDSVSQSLTAFKMHPLNKFYNSSEYPNFELI